MIMVQESRLMNVIAGVVEEILQRKKSPEEYLKEKN